MHQALRWGVSSRVVTLPVSCLCPDTAGNLGPAVTTWLTTGLYDGKAPATDGLCSILEEEPSARQTTT